jgi:hypothetical protein
MTHTSADFTAHVLGLLKKTGTTGHSGHGPDKPFNSKDKVGTTRGTPVVPLETDWSQPLRASGTRIITEKQSLIDPVTSVTTGTAIFEGGLDHPANGSVPSDWYAILAELEQQNCPDWLAPDRWAVMLSDAESFLGRWGDTAHQLGWTALDLFGVHPIAPAARFDLMGLALLLHGGAVIALTEDAATIRRSSNAILAYRRGDQAEAVCITRITP